MKKPSIFISYRRSDAEGWAGRLSDSLRSHLGSGVRIFRDIEEIPPGVDFVDYFTKAVAECNAFIEIIGPDWLNAADAKGQRRLDDPNDPTRVELTAAFKRDIRVIPVLIEGTEMPKAADLPQDLQPLARRNAYPLSDSRWAEDTKKLADILREIVKPPRSRLRLILGAAAVVAAIVIGIALYNSYRSRPPVNPYVPRTVDPRPVKKRQPGSVVNPAVDQASVEIQSAVCTRIASGQYRVQMSGYASAPAQSFFAASSNPNNGIDESMLTRCGSWSQSEPSDGPRNQRMCKRGVNEPGTTRWQSTNVFRSNTAPPEGCADVYKMPSPEAQATILYHRCVPLVCQ